MKAVQSTDIFMLWFHVNLLHAACCNVLCNNYRLSYVMENIHGCNIFASSIFSITLESLHNCTKNCSTLHATIAHESAALQCLQPAQHTWYQSELKKLTFWPQHFHASCLVTGGFSINQLIYLSRNTRHRTRHQGRMQSRLTGAYKNNVIKNDYT